MSDARSARSKSVYVALRAKTAPGRACRSRPGRATNHAPPRPTRSERRRRLPRRQDARRARPGCIGGILLYLPSGRLRAFAVFASARAHACSSSSETIALHEALRHRRSAAPRRPRAAWLATRMTALGTAITESVVHHYGRSALLSRLSDPFWFQALGAVMGMDWHSSGITTSVMGALEARAESARARARPLRLRRPRHATRATRPTSCARSPSAYGLDGDALVRTSRLTARVDNNAIADGFQIYLHALRPRRPTASGRSCSRA